MVKNFLNWLASKNELAAFAKKKYKRAAIRIRNFYYWRQKMDSKLVVFEAYRSRSYADSPKAIYEYMLRDDTYKDYKFIWSFREPDNYQHLVNERTKVVRHESHGYFLAFAKAKYWVVNGWIPQRVQKRPDQIALQCWHGTPLKRLRHDIVSTAETAHRERAVRDNNWDILRFNYFISPSKFASTVFTSAFGLRELKKENILIETGYPRNDILKNYTPTIISDLKEKLGLPKDKKVMLYAPTWRDDEREEGVKNYQPDFSYLKKLLGDEYIILFRAHYLIAEIFNFAEYPGFVYDVSDVDDVNDLYLVSDVLVTDYSSVFFDYANLGRPMIFFMYDLEYYQTKLRGFYLDLKELPGDIVKTEHELVASVNQLSEFKSKYESAYRKFNSKYNYLDDGSATGRVVEAFASSD